MSTMYALLEIKMIMPLESGGNNAVISRVTKVSKVRNYPVKEEKRTW